LAHDATVAIHVGDMAYDLEFDGGENGDAFMNQIQDIAANIPYMTCVGNHEPGEANDFAHYRYRFSMPRFEENDGYEMWHSWNIQLIHFIAYDTEVFYSRPQDTGRQLQWLTQDLEQANKERDIRPWIVAFGHRPMYCSNMDDDECTTPDNPVRNTGLEDVFMKYGVDIIIEAHEHSYERLYPVYDWNVMSTSYIDPPAPIHLITGAAGCNEDDGDCLNLIGPPLGPWSAFRYSGKWSYGYAHMAAYNATHLYWDEVVDWNRTVIDRLWIVQNHHGPFIFPPVLTPVQQQAKLQTIAQIKAKALTHAKGKEIGQLNNYHDHLKRKKS